MSANWTCCLTDFDFRYNSRESVCVEDEARADRVIGGIVGKRLVYYVN